MKKRVLIVIGVLLVFSVFQSCSSKPEQGLLQRYFAAVSMNDNDTMSAMALEPLQLDVASWKIVSVSEEKVEPFSLPELNKKELDLKKELEQHVGPTMDAKDTLDAAEEDMTLARTANARAAAKKKVDELQAKYDEIRNAHTQLQKDYNDAKAAAADEESDAKFSLGIRELPNIRDLTGTVHSKDVVVSITTKGGQTVEYKLPMRMYQLKDEATGANYKGRWIILSFQPTS
jgi:hypothetical protein